MEEELFVVTSKRKDGGIPHAAKIIGSSWFGNDFAAFFCTEEDAERYAETLNKQMEASKTMLGVPAPAGHPYKVYRAVTYLEECGG